MEPKILQSKKVNKDKDAKKTKVQTAVAGILILVFIYLLVTTFMGGKKPKSPAAPAAGAPALPPAESVVELFPETGAANTNAGGPKTSASETADEWGSSPFTMEVEEPLEAETVAVKPKSKLKLGGIVYSGSEDSYAIINEKIVKKGDRIADSMIKEITPDEVLVESDEGELSTLGD